MNTQQLKILIIAFIIGLTGLLSMYTVHETQRAIVQTLGKIKQDSQGNIYVAKPGLHFKLPFVSRALYFEKRLQTLNIEQSRIVTVNKKDVIVDSYIKWRINDFVKYYTATGGNKRSAELLLRQIANDGLRAQFGKRTIEDVVSGERLDVMKVIKEEVAKNAMSYGIVVNDVRIKKIDLPQEVSESVFERMRAEREQAAAQHRAEGKMAAEKIRADADAKETVILAEAYREANKARGEGDAQAAKIYADAYNKNPEFYAFYKSLSAYEHVLHPGDTFVLKPDSEFFRYFSEKKHAS